MNEATVTVERIIDLEDRITSLRIIRDQQRRHINILLRGIDPSKTELLAVRYVYRYYNPGGADPSPAANPAPAAEAPNGGEGDLGVVVDGEADRTSTGTCSGRV